MGEIEAPAVQITLTTKGVLRISLCADGWEQGAEAKAIYERIEHLVKEMDLVLTNRQSASKPGAIH